jgi:hypothetical protein
MLVFWLILLTMPGLALRPNRIATKLKKEVQVVLKANKDKGINWTLHSQNLVK